MGIPRKMQICEYYGEHDRRLKFSKVAGCGSWKIVLQLRSA